MYLLGSNLSLFPGELPKIGGMDGVRVMMAGRSVSESNPLQSASSYKMDGPRMPPYTANIGQACYTCFKEELRDGVTLQKCAMCRMVRYCGVGM